MWFIVVIFVTVYLVYSTLIEPLSYWRKRKVVHGKPWPLLGNASSFVFGTKSSIELFQDLYNQFPNERYFGMHLFLMPALVIRDLDLIKQMGIRDFNHFVDRSIFRLGDDVDPCLSKCILMLYGQKWRDMRSALTPCFSGSKIKFMFGLISECAQEFVKFLEKQGPGVVEVEMHHIFSRFTNDVIATTAFGLKVDSLSNQDNEFYHLGRQLSEFEGLRALRLITCTAYPKLMKFLGISGLPPRLTKYLHQIIKNTIKVRLSTGIVRRDMIHIMLEARKTAESDKVKNIIRDLSDESITGQAMLFFTAGFLTISNSMTYMAYELAVNPEVQQKLQKEIDETLEQCNGQITYEALIRMKYLDMVLSETFRKWPAAAAFNRLCTKDYIIPPKLPHEKPLLVEKGTTVLFPYSGIQHDPKYFPNPTVFDPERFSEANKANIVPLSNIPFGVGPRDCLAKKYSAMEIKIGFCHLLSQFDIVTTKRTHIPPVAQKFKLNLGTQGGMWLRLQQRKMVI